VAWITFDLNCFAILAGRPTIFDSSAGVRRRFCGACGSALTYQRTKSPVTVDVTTATLDDPAVFPPTAEIWLEDRLHWQPTDRTLEQRLRSSDQ
jgi:hypothetical protein